MTRAYYSDSHVLPDVAVFRVPTPYQPGGRLADGWYYWSPLTQSEPVGPFDTEAEALAQSTE